MTPWEEQEERIVADIFKRPRCKYILDRPYYPYFPPTPIIPKINFDLGYKQ